MKNGQVKEENPVLNAAKVPIFKQNCQYYGVRSTEMKKVDAYPRVLDIL